MKKITKFIFILFLGGILGIGIQSLLLFLFVNSGFTNEKGGIGNQIKLQKDLKNELTLTGNKLNIGILDNSKPINKLQLLIELRDKDGINDLENIKYKLEQYILQKKEIERKKEGISLCIISKIRENDTTIGNLFIKEYKNNGFEGINKKYIILQNFLSNVGKEKDFLKNCSNSKMTIEEFNSIIKKQKEKSLYLGTLSKNKSFLYITDFFIDEEENKKLDNVISILGNEVLKEEIISIITSEQVRASNTYRGLFKSIMKNNILQSYTQFSLGISGIKENTAIKIENNLKNPKSLFYLGKKYENLLNFNTKNIKKERLDRLTNQKDYYRQYLYTGLFIKMIKNQWKKEGYPLGNNHIGIISTLFNIGIDKSQPKDNPSLGGSLIKVDGQTYLFGEISEISYLYQRIKQ